MILQEGAPSIASRPPWTNSCQRICALGISLTWKRFCGCTSNMTRWYKRRDWGLEGGPSLGVLGGVNEGWPIWRGGEGVFEGLSFGSCLKKRLNSQLGRRLFCRFLNSPNEMLGFLLVRLVSNRTWKSWTVIWRAEKPPICVFRSSLVIQFNSISTQNIRPESNSKVDPSGLHLYKFPTKPHSKSKEQLFGVCFLWGEQLWNDGLIHELLSAFGFLAENRAKSK